MILNSRRLRTFSSKLRFSCATNLRILAATGIPSEDVTDAKLTDESRCDQHGCKDCYREQCGDVFVDDMVLLQGNEVGDHSEEYPAAITEEVDKEDLQLEGEAGAAANQNAKAVVFSLRNQVGGLVRALRVFKVR